MLQLDPPAYLYVSPGARQLIGVDTESAADPDLTHAMVRVHPETGEKVMPSPEELRLAYVAATRAERERLGV
mgnify:CR=1 FL=1